MSSRCIAFQRHSHYKQKYGFRSVEIAEPRRLLLSLISGVYTDFRHRFKTYTESVDERRQTNWSNKSQAKKHRRHRGISMKHKLITAALVTFGLNFFSACDSKKAASTASNKPSKNTECSSKTKSKKKANLKASSPV